MNFTEYRLLSGTLEPVLKDHPTKNVVCQDRWPLLTGSSILKCRSFCRKCMVCQDRWSLMAVVSQDMFHCMQFVSPSPPAIQTNLPGGGITAGLTTAKTVTRVILRDSAGRFCWDNSVLYGPPRCRAGSYPAGRFKQHVKKSM